MSHEALIERIRKLKAKAEDPATTEEEATLFATKVAQLLAQHNLDEAALEGEAPEDFVEDDIVNWKTGDTWTQLVATGVAKLYFCDTYLMIQKRSQRTRIIFVGKKHNVEIAKSMASYLINTIGRLATEYAHSPAAKADWNYTHGKARRGFERGAGARIWTRLHKMYEQQAYNAEPKRSEAGNPSNLPALYEDEATALKVHMDRLEIPDPSPNKGGISLDGGHAQAGMRAADDISLQGQVEGGKTSALPNPKGKP